MDHLESLFVILRKLFGFQRRPSSAQWARLAKPITIRSRPVSNTSNRIGLLVELPGKIASNSIAAALLPRRRSVSSTSGAGFVLSAPARRHRSGGSAVDRGSLDRSHFVHLACQAPVGREIDEYGITAVDELLEPASRKRSPPTTRAGTFTARLPVPRDRHQLVPPLAFGDRPRVSAASSTGGLFA